MAPQATHLRGVSALLCEVAALLEDPGSQQVACVHWPLMTSVETQQHFEAVCFDYTWTCV